MKRPMIRKRVLILVTLFMVFLLQSFLASKSPHQQWQVAIRQVGSAIMKPFAQPSQLAKGRGIGEPQRDPLAYHGTEVVFSPQSLIQSPQSHEGIKAAFRRNDPKPPQRQARFGYLSSVIPNVRITGWYAGVCEVVPNMHGLLVKAHFSPSIAAPNAGILSTTDSWVEIYQYSPHQETLTFLRAEEAANPPLRAVMGD